MIADRLEATKASSGPANTRFQLQGGLETDPSFLSVPLQGTEFRIESEARIVQAKNA